MAKGTDSTPFEPSLERLEEIVQQLESGTLPLEQALKLFEEGVGLSRQCLKVLSEAEVKVEKLVGAGTVPFQPESGGASE